MQNVSSASLAQAVNSHVTVQVEGHVTLGLESAASDVLQAFMEINASWVRLNLLHCASNFKSAETFLKKNLRTAVDFILDFTF